MKPTTGGGEKEGAQDSAQAKVLSQRLGISSLDLVGLYFSTSYFYYCLPGVLVREPEGLAHTDCAQVGGGEIEVDTHWTGP